MVDKKVERAWWQWPIAWWTAWVVVPWRREEERFRRKTCEEKAPAWRAVTVLVTVAVCLTLIEYLGKNQHFWDYIHPRPMTDAVLDMVKRGYMLQPQSAPRGWYHFQVLLQPLRDLNTADAHLLQLLYWGVWCVVTYLVLPCLVVKVIFKQRLRDYGMRMEGWTRHLWVYVLLFLALVPVLVIVSDMPSFQATYPFFRHAGTSPRAFWIWQVAYAAQFLSLEFFFRGFMLHGLRDRLGPMAIFVMILPYCMIHFGKPMSETLGAIIAGFILGLLSLRTGSIFLGFLIHVSVALAMDLLSLWRQGHLEGVLGIFG